MQAGWETLRFGHGMASHWLGDAADSMLDICPTHEHSLPAFRAQWLALSRSTTFISSRKRV